jgi:hypothetical protein
MALEPKIWGPYYWFVLHTIALTYPQNTNDVTKKKYYDFIQNLPLFIPVPEIGNTFSNLINQYPVTPYLDSQQSFMKWMHFIHNKINNSLGLDEVTMDESLSSYYELYRPKAVKDEEQRKRREKIAFMAFVGCIGLSGLYLYNK